ncbi:MAG TPA: ABC transporter permease [Nocardioidaceae bacterium]|nr:ABC transporter permease [Nocardioidaceae bacterium]
MSPDGAPADVRLSPTQAVWLVAERELRTRLRSKAFRITTVALVVLVVAFAVVMSLIGSLGSTSKVGLTEATAGLQQQVVATAKAQGRDVVAVVVSSEAAGRKQVSNGKLDALVVGTSGARLQVVVDKSLDDSLRATLTAVAGRAALNSAISRLGGDPEQVAAQVARADVSVSALQPETTYSPQRLAVGSVAGILIYLALIATGQLVAMGVVEEKSSRVVELLLATIRPWQLMAGKVLGIGLIGLIQVAVVGIAGMLAGQLAGSLSLSVSASVGIVVWLIVWFVLGFTLYSLVFAGLGALVSRQEDVGGVVAPATMLLVVGYVVGISVLPSSPANTAVAVMSLLPAFSPTLMPMRLAMGAVPVWQIAVSLVLALAAIPLLVALAGRTYRNGVVRTGARVSLRDAVRP